MSTLLLDKDLRTSDEDSEVRTLARARTLLVLERLDPSRKTQVMEFLVEEELVGGVDLKMPIEAPIIPLNGANLSGADLSGADLGGAYLTDANLSDAKGVTNEELEQQALSLVDATMPNGQKYEDWLESEERGEDGEDSGSS
jgi:uncharacterized protein YjbI with pentapeptide repeats